MLPPFVKVGVCSACTLMDSFFLQKVTQTHGFYGISHSPELKSLK